MPVPRICHNRHRAAARSAISRVPAEPLWSITTSTPSNWRARSSAGSYTFNRWRSPMAAITSWPQGWNNDSRTGWGRSRMFSGWLMPGSPQLRSEVWEPSPPSVVSAASQRSAGSRNGSSGSFGRPPDLGTAVWKAYQNRIPDSKGAPFRLEDTFEESRTDGLE